MIYNDRDMVDVEGEVADNTVVQKLFSEIAPQYADRAGGYTRLIRLAERRIGDAGRQVIIQLVAESTDKAARKKGKGVSRRRHRAEKRYAAAGVAAERKPDEGKRREETAEADAPAEQGDQAQQGQSPEDAGAGDKAEA